MEKERSEMLKRIGKLVDPYRVTRGKKFRLKDFDPGDTGGLGSDHKPEARELLEKGIQWLAEEQDKLYAQDRHSLLLLFQAMDAAGKDGTIRHVMSGVNPQGCQVYSFKQPSAEELDHDFLWRCQKCLPERGRIGIFNRSYYEEVLVVRVHPELLEGRKLPPGSVTRGIWKERLDDIAGFERYLARQGTIVLKFFLHVSRKEQKRRFLQRLEQPEKNWKFSSGRPRGAEVLGRLHGRLRGRHPSHGFPRSPVVRGAGGQQVVYAAGGRRGDRRSSPEARPGVSRDRRGRKEGNRRREAFVDAGKGINPGIRVADEVQLHDGFDPGSGGTGIWMTNRVPTPRRLSAWRVPSCDSTICFTMERPSPVPPSSRDLPLSTR